MKKLLFAGLIAAAVSFAACNEKKDSTDMAEQKNDQMLDSTNNTKMDDDADFAVAAANGGMMEVKTSELAKTKGVSPTTMAFAEMMVKDHTAAADELKSIAGMKNIALPATLGSDKQKAYDDLAAKSGKDFEKAYCDMMQGDHKDAIDLFQKEADNGKNQALKDFAAKTLPTLKMHQDKIDAIVKSM